MLEEWWPEPKVHAMISPPLVTMHWDATQQPNYIESIVPTNDGLMTKSEEVKPKKSGVTRQLTVYKKLRKPNQTVANLLAKRLTPWFAVQKQGQSGGEIPHVELHRSFKAEHSQSCNNCSFTPLLVLRETRGHVLASTCRQRHWEITEILPLLKAAHLQRWYLSKLSQNHK